MLALAALSVAAVTQVQAQAKAGSRLIDDISAG